MRSWKFPNMISAGNSAAIWKESEQGEATRQNAKLLLQSERNGTFGDPYIGLNNMLFEQNSYILRDISADNIYTQIALFLPQIKVKRDDIKIITDSVKGKVICTFTGINQVDYTNNTYSLVVFDSNGGKTL